MGHTVACSRYEGTQLGSVSQKQVEMINFESHVVCTSAQYLLLPIIASRVDR